MSIFLKAILDMPFIFPVKLLFPKIFSCIKFFARFSDVAIANSLAQLCKYQTPWIKVWKINFQGGVTNGSEFTVGPLDWSSYHVVKENNGGHYGRFHE